MNDTESYWQNYERHGLIRKELGQANKAAISMRWQLQHSALWASNS